MAVNIEEYYRTRQAEYEAAASAANKARKALHEKLKALEAQAETLEAERAAKQTRKREAEAEGLDTGPLNQKLTAIADQIGAVAREAEALRAQIARTEPAPATVDYAAMREAARVLARLGCDSAVEVPDLAGCARVLRVQPTQYSRASQRDEFKCDELGRPLECHVRFGVHTSLTVPIKPSDRHYMRAFRPQSLSWVPRPAAEEEGGNGTTAPQGEAPESEAFIESASGRVILPSGLHDLDWPEVDSQDKWRREANDRQRKEDQETLLASFRLLPDLFAEHLKAAGGTLDLSNGEPGSPLLAAVRSQVIPLTTEAPPFPPTPKPLPSGEVYTLLKPHWDRFVAAPWSGEITGPLALLKYHLENGERARFWCNAHQNHYGFRLRTRDHSWLTGAVFVEPGAEAAPPSAGIDVVEDSNGYSPMVATIGSMHLLVGESK